MNPTKFFEDLRPFAQETQDQTGIPASFILAQAALESGWGESKLAVEGKNLFGIKADPSWTGEVIYMPTKEYLNGQWVSGMAKWRKYQDWNGSFADHAQFFQVNHRYHNCFQFHTGREWAKAVAAAGYATDPEYANKLIGIIEQYGLETKPAIKPDTSVSWWDRIKLLFTFFRQGEALISATKTANRTAMVSSLFAVLAGLASMGQWYGFDFGLTQDQLKELASSLVYIVLIGSQFLHLASNPLAGVRAKGDN